MAQLVEQLICNQQVGGSSPSTGSIDSAIYGGIPEWPKGADCKSVSSAFGGSNPPSPTNKKHHPSGWCFLLVWVFGRRIRKAALGDSPVDCRNRRGFSAEKRIHLPPTRKETSFVYRTKEVSFQRNQSFAGFGGYSICTRLRL